jgi:hypothetical protein
MRKYKWLLLVFLIIPVLLTTACLPGEEIETHVKVIDQAGIANGINDTAGSLDVNVTGGSVVATVPNPLPVSGTVTAIIPTPVPVIQSVTADAHNSSVANVNAGATFTGTSTSTLGVAGIQVSLKTDQNCTVYVEQSPTDGGAPNWDVVDSFSYIYALGGNSWTVQAVNSYVRIRVTNIGASNTTYFRLQTALCPIVEALPRSLNEDGRLKVDATLMDEYGFNVENTPMGEMRVVEPVKLVGANFIGTTVDSSFWTISNANSGTTTQANGALTLATNTSGGGSTAVTSVRRGRYVAGSSMRYRAVIQIDAGLANNVKRWGVADWATMPTITDGAYFIMNGTTFGVATMKGSTQTLVSNGSFNGNYGNTYSIGTNAQTYEIYWTNSKVYFVIDGEVLHTVTASTATWTSTVTMYLWMDNVNGGGVSTNKTLICRVASIARLGSIQTATNYKHISAQTTTVCKYGAGNLHYITINTPANNTITVYDNVAGSGTVVAVITLGNNTTPFTLTFNSEFFTGLSIVTGAAMDLTVVYE